MSKPLFYFMGSIAVGAFLLAVLGLPYWIGAAVILHFYK